MANINSIQQQYARLLKPLQKFPGRKSGSTHVNESRGPAEPALTNNPALLGRKILANSLRHAHAFFSRYQEAQTAEATDKQQDSKVFDIDKVVDNVLSFIGTTLAKAKTDGKTDDELTKMFAQARAGVTQGFADARKDLSDVAAINDSLASAMDTSEHRIFQGIDELQQNFFQDDTDAQKPLPPAAIQAVNSVQASQTSISSASDLRIETAEGDVVTISFNAARQSMQSGTWQYSRLGNQQTNSYQLFSGQETSSNFQFTVAGELNVTEQDAIASLVKDIAHLQRSFFSGNIDKAFRQALQLGYDEHQLTGFSLELQQTKMTQALQSYQQLANESPLKANADSPYKPLRDFVGKFHQMRQQAKKILAQHDETLPRLMTGVLDATGVDQAPKASFDDFIAKL